VSKISRRRLIITGLAAAAGASGLGVAAKLAERYGLIPPDAGVLYGAGETLTYAAQRILTRHSLAREFSPRDISKAPFANEVIPPLSEEFHRMQRGGFADWRLTVDGMVGRPASFSLRELKKLPLSHPNHAHRVRRRLVIYRRMERRAPLSHP
jgi:DMSO/TMAO reductase YedYZ molybdopterin-dependent catalytic subunit